MAGSVRPATARRCRPSARRNSARRPSSAWNAAARRHRNASCRTSAPVNGIAGHLMATTPFASRSMPPVPSASARPAVATSTNGPAPTGPGTAGFARTVSVHRRQPYRQVLGRDSVPFTFDPPLRRCCRACFPGPPGLRRRSGQAPFRSLVVLRRRGAARLLPHPSGPAWLSRLSRSRSPQVLLVEVRSPSGREDVFQVEFQAGEQR